MQLEVVQKHWRVTHILDMCSAILVSGFHYTLKSNSHSGKIFSHSCQQCSSAKTLDSNSQPECKFSHFCQWFQSAQELKSNSQPGCTFIHNSGSDLIGHWRVTYILNMCSVIFISGSDLPKCWRATHILDECSAILVRGSDPIKQHSLPECMFIHSCWWVWFAKTLENDSPTG